MLLSPKCLCPSQFYHFPSQSTLSLDDLIYSDGFSCHLYRFQVDRTATWHIQLTLTAGNAGSDTWGQKGHPNRPTRETFTMINSPSLTRIWLSVLQTGNLSMTLSEYFKQWRLMYTTPKPKCELPVRNMTDW